MVKILYFAACRERAGIAEEVLDVAGLCLRDLVALVTERHPDLAPVLPRCRIAVNESFVHDDSMRIEDRSEVALIPPVSGGAHDQKKARVQETPLSVDEAIATVVHEGAGAIVVMLGLVRDHTGTTGVSRLEYEAYVPMAEKVIGDIVFETEETFPGTRGIVLHRTGQLGISEVAVVVAVSSPHRQPAFAACARIIDRLKEDAPIWKREHRDDGVIWVGLGP